MTIHVHNIDGSLSGELLNFHVQLLLKLPQQSVVHNEQLASWKELTQHQCNAVHLAGHVGRLVEDTAVFVQVLHEHLQRVLGEHAVLVRVAQQHEGAVESAQPHRRLDTAGRPAVTARLPAAREPDEAEF